MADQMPTDGVPKLGRVARATDLTQLLRGLGLPIGRPVVVSVGGASRMEQEKVEAVERFFGDSLLPILQRLDAVVVDGGTDAGVMRAMGRAVRSSGSNIPLVGVAPEAIVELPGRAATNVSRVAIEPNHSHVILVPGSTWGDESPWLADVASALAADAPSVTLVINGGDTTYADVANSISRQRPVIVVSGSGRAADEIASAVQGHGIDGRAVDLVTAGNLLVAEFGAGSGIAETVDACLAARARHRPG